MTGFLRASLLVSLAATACGSSSTVTLVDSSNPNAGVSGRGNDSASGGAASSGLPPLPSGPPGVATAIVSGLVHSCALLTDGTVKCWGDNSVGQLGVGAKSCLFGSALPLPVANLSGVVALAAGLLHTCALLDNGTVKCWGEDPAGAADTTTPIAFDPGNDEPCPVIVSSGELETFGSSPGLVPGLAGVVSLAAGNDADCAVLSDGSVSCWGLAGYGELGNGESDGTSTKTPVTVQNVSGAVSVADGQFSSCAVQSNGYVRCWGANESGELGDGTMTDASVPVTALNIDNATQVVVGTRASSPGCTTCDGFSCALLADQTVACWGTGQDGELGNGSTSASATPVPVSNLSGVERITGAPGKAYALLSDGTLAAWGSNFCGELGNGQMDDAFTPIRIPGIAGVRAVSAGVCFACAVLADGSVECWGDNGSGALGNSSVQSSLVPVPVAL